MGSVRLVGCSTLLLFILNPQSHHTYKYIKHDLNIIQTGKSWDDASQSCTLVGSKRAPSYDVIVQDIPVLQHPPTTHRPEGLYWIGATATFTPWLELLGCYIYKAISTIRTFKYRYRGLGAVADCYLQCESHFGVNESHCHCLPNLEQGGLNNKSCRLIAPGHSDIVGTNVSTGYNGELYQIAIYKIYYSTFNINDDTLDECLLNSTTRFSTHPCDVPNSSNRKWTDAIIDGLPLKDGGQLQWTRFTRRRIIRWTRGHILDLNMSACVSVKELSNMQEYEIVLRPCNYKLPYICLKGDAQNTHKIMTSPLPTSPLMPGRPENTISSNGGQNTHPIMTSSLPTSPGSTMSSNGETGSLSMVVEMVFGGGVLVLFIVAIVIFKLRRRSQSKPQPDLATAETNSYSEMVVKSEERSSHHSSQNNESSMCTTSNTVIKPTGREEESSKMLLMGDDNVYNHPWDKPVTDQQSNHVYSTIRSGGEYDYSQMPGINSDVYNHTWDKPITEQISDHVYSTTGCKNDANLYDHTGYKESN